MGRTGIRWQEEAYIDRMSAIARTKSGKMRDYHRRDASCCSFGAEGCLPKVNPSRRAEPNKGRRGYKTLF